MMGFVSFTVWVAYGLMLFGFGLSGLGLCGIGLWVVWTGTAPMVSAVGAMCRGLSVKDDARASST